MREAHNTKENRRTNNDLIIKIMKWHENEQWGKQENIHGSVENYKQKLAILGEVEM